jgi:hypothetical protein
MVIIIFLIKNIKGAAFFIRSEMLRKLIFYEKKICHY